MKKKDLKSLLRVFLVIVCVIVSVSVNAQIVKVYENGTLSATYTNSSANIVRVPVNAQTVKVYENGTLSATYTNGSTNVVKVVVEEVPEQTHEYVDLGLPSGTLWATCNIGANSPEEYGLYFAWGETLGHSDAVNEGTTTCTDGYSYKWSKTPFNGGNTSYSSDYFTSTGRAEATGSADGTELLAIYDAATSKWGSEWQMPSSTQIEELTNSSYTTAKWTTYNDVYGVLITSKMSGYTDKSIFFPAAGYRYGTTFYKIGTKGIFYSRTLNSDDIDYACNLYILSSGQGLSRASRCLAAPVRAVRVQK